MKPLSSWGNLSAHRHNIVALQNDHTMADSLKQSLPGIAYGMGRSYGDICLNTNGTVWQTTSLDRFIQFDSQTGLLQCHAGAQLHDIQSWALKRGWILPVTPGTLFVTIGGAIANNVHGKNHHQCGSFCDHVEQFTLQRTDGERITCSHSTNSDWFSATVGGLGLTGLILDACIRLKRVTSPWLTVETLPFYNLQDFFDLTQRSVSHWEYTVSWIDCLARGNHRGLFMRANPTENKGLMPSAVKSVNMPFTPPVSLFNKLTLRPLNSAYFHLKKRNQKPTAVGYKQFCYPLDGITHWNRIYGPKGFYQYQSVVPLDVGFDTTQEMLDVISNSGEGSLLAVLKTFGKCTSVGLLSFPRPGVTFALDFPNRGRRTIKLLERLDAIVAAAGGRLYPAKDARMPRELFESGYPRLPAFIPFRDPGISSDMSRRLFGS